MGTGKRRTDHYRQRYLDIFDQRVARAYSPAVSQFALAAPRYLRITAARLMEYATDAQAQRFLEAVARLAASMKAKELDAHLRSDAFTFPGSPLKASLDVRLSETEYAALQELAAYEGITPAAYLRNALLKEARFAAAHRYVAGKG